MKDVRLENTARVRSVGAGALLGACFLVACGGGAGGATDKDGGGPGGDGGTGPGDGAIHHGGDSGSKDGGGGGSGDSGSPSDGGGDAKGGKDSGPPTGGMHVVMGTGGAPGHIVDGSGKTVQLHGVDRSGTEYSCLYGGFFDGPADQNSLNAMLAWNINAVRVPLNADCWLGVNGVPSAQAGTNYQNAIQTWVNLITTNKMVAILDLHWTAPGSNLANSQTPMADADHAPMFWSQVAAMFKTNDLVIFDLFNEPYLSDWTCWLQGGMCAQWNSATYNVAGMASLLQSVRNAGANNVVILGGLGYSSDMSQWVKEVQSIPTLAAPLDGISIDNVAVSWHAYDFNSEQSGCPSQYNGYSATCYSGAQTAMNTSVTSVLAAGFPLIIGESGISAYDSTTAANFSSSQLTEIENWYDDLLGWAEGQGQSYMAWSWNTDTPPLLLTDYSGSASPYFGQTYQTHLMKF